MRFVATKTPEQVSATAANDRKASDRRLDTKLGKMCPNRIDHRGLLADEQMTRAVQRQAALLVVGR